MTWMESVEIIGSIIAFLGTALGVVLWVILQNVVRDMKAIEKDLNDHKIYSSREFINNEKLKPLTDSIAELMKTVNSMSVTLGVLAEKLNHSRLSSDRE